MWGCMVLWLAALFVACCRAQECATSCELGLQTCSIIDYPIFYHNTSEVNSAESVATQIIAFTQIAGLSTACANTLAPFICNQYHPSCETNISSTGTPVPILSCIEMCNNLNAVCGEYKTNTLASIARYFNCSDESIYTPEGSTNCSYINSNIPTCSNDTSPISGYTGSCQKFDPQIAPTSYETCAPFTTEYVWVSQNSPFIVALLDQNLNQSIYNMKVSFPIVPIDCYENILGVVCSLFFPPCQIADVPEYNTSVAVPNQACFSICETAFDVCHDFFIQANLNFSLSICAALPSTSPYQYPLIGTEVNVTTTCHTTLIPDGAIAPFTLPVVEQCPMETGKKTHVTDSDAICGLKCPDSSYTDNEWHDLVILTQVGSSLSLVCMAFLITSYMLTYERRKFPSALHFWEFVATSGFAISFLIGGTDPAKNVWCYDEGTYATQANNAACGTQGFFFIFFGLALAAWCCIIAFIMFYGIVLGRKVVNLEEYSAFFHLFGWGVPLVFGIAALGSGSIGYGPPLAWCFIQFKGFGMGTGNGISMDYPLFYIPVGVLFLAILVMFWATVAKIIYVRKLKVDDKSVGKAGSRTFKAQVRVLIFIFVVFAICFTLFEWRFQVEATNRKNNLGFIGLQWTYCKVKQQLNSTDAGYCPGDHNPARVDYAHTAFESFLLSGVGLLIFIGFGADLGIYRHWRKILRLVSSREWGVLRDLVVFGKDPFASSSETGRSKSHSKSASKNSAGSKNSKNSNSGVSKADQTSASMEEAERRSRFIREESVGDVDLSQLSETPPPPKKEIEVFII